MPEHKGQSCFSISLSARQAASWRRCLSRLAGFHTSDTLLVWPTLATGRSLTDNGTSRIYPLANIAKNGNSRKFPLTILTHSTVSYVYIYIFSVRMVKHMAIPSASGMWENQVQNPALKSIFLPHLLNKRSVDDQLIGQWLFLSENLCVAILIRVSKYW